MIENTNNLINVYDKDTHPNEKCQKIKTEWIKHCDNLNRKNVSLKNDKECSALFSKYYECIFKDLTKN